MPASVPLPAPSPAPRLATLGATSSALVITGQSLAPEQKLFNQLLAKLEDSKAALQILRQLADRHRAQTAQRVFPLQLQQRVLKKQITLFLDQRLQQSHGLSKAVRAYLREVLFNLAFELLRFNDDAELKVVYERYAGTSGNASNADAKAAAAEAMQAMMADVFGAEMDDAGHDSPEQALADALRKIQEQRERQEQNAAEHAARQAKRKKTPKQAKAERDCIDADKVLRDIYRKLASALHPDREPDEKERQRKTALMVEVNIANEKKDLLALLQLQLKAEQIDAAAVALIAEDKLRYFNRVLKDQVARVQAELKQEQAMFRAEFNLSYGPITPKLFETALRYDVREHEYFINQLEQDIEQVQHDSGLKSWVKLQKSLRDQEDDEFDALELMSMRAAQTGRR